MLKFDRQSTAAGNHAQKKPHCSRSLQVERLPALAAELARRPVAVLVAGGSPQTALAVKAATTTIPIVFGVGQDPVRLGLVASLGRPGGNATGIFFLNTYLTANLLEFMLV